jgi:hypothetical protein
MAARGAWYWMMGHVSPLSSSQLKKLRAGSGGQVRRFWDLHTVSFIWSCVLFFVNFISFFDKFALIRKSIS